MRSLESDRIRTFWNDKARENPYWYVSSYGDYGAQRDLDEFWSSGVHIWRQLKAAIGYSPRPADVVVDIGCGVGRLTRAIAPEVGHVHAFDISEEMLGIARQAGLANATFHAAQSFSLAPLPDRSADLVLAYCVFQHLPSVEALRTYLADMARVAKPKGMIAFTLGVRNWRYHLLPVLRARAWFRERLGQGGPSGLYQKEWVGIRPARSTVRDVSPVPLQLTTLFDDKWLFFGMPQR